MGKTIDEISKEVRCIVEEAGDLLLSYFGKIRDVRYKQDGSLVTEADVAVERFLVKKLSPLIPQASFFAEESGSVQNGDYCWVIDPIDGTTNFFKGIAHFCISVALTHKNKQKIGIIYQPVSKELFMAVEGGGSYLNEIKLKVSEQRAISRSVMAIGFPRECHTKYVKAAYKLNQNVYSSRVLGSAALDLAYCAAGRVDFVICKGLSWWDIAAGELIIREAGGVTQQFDTSLITPSWESFLGGNRLILDKVTALISDL